MAPLINKAPASTLVETIISMVIITVCLGIAVVVIQNVFRSDRMNYSLKAFILAKNTLKETEQNKSFFDEEMLSEDLTLNKTITNYKGYESLVDVQVHVYLKHNHSLLYKTRKIFVKYHAWPPK